MSENKKVPSLKHFIISEEKEIAYLTINRPEAMNALSGECWKEILLFMEYAEQNKEIKVIIITGTGEKAFAAGADIVNLQTLSGIDNLYTSVSKKALESLQTSNKVVIAAVNGFAFGGGFELALACDIRIVSENSLLGLPETNLGIIPGAGGTQRLAKLVGESITKQVVLGGRVLSGEDAERLGIAMKCVPLSDLIEESKKVAVTVTRKGPLAVSLAKQVINSALNTSLETGLIMEKLAFSVLLESKDKAEGVSAFLEKRHPKFKGE